MPLARCRFVRWPEPSAALLPQCQAAAPVAGTEYQRESPEGLKQAVGPVMKTSTRVARSTSQSRVQIRLVGCQDSHPALWWPRVEFWPQPPIPPSQFLFRREPLSDRGTADTRPPSNPIIP